MKTLLIALFLCAGVVSSHAQTDSLESRFALMFQVGPNFNVQSLNGPGMTFAWRVKPTRELRVSVNVGRGNGNNDASRTFYDADRAIEGRYIDDTETNFSGVGIQLHWVSEIAQKNNVKAYYGFGPSVSLLRDNDEISITNTDGGLNVLSDVRITDEIRTNTYGLSGFLGMEYSFSSQLSIFGEYHGLVGVTNTEERLERFETTPTDVIGEFQRTSVLFEQSSDVLQLGLNGARFGIIFRF